MATDLETGKEQGETTNVRPSLKITGLHIRGLKSINSLDLPEDGLGWDGPIPDFVMVAGSNGSGKTTLLEFLAEVFDQIVDFAPNGRLGLASPLLRASEVRIDFAYSILGQEPETIRFLIGNDRFVDENADGLWFGLRYAERAVREQSINVGSGINTLRLAYYSGKGSPVSSNQREFFHVVYFPSEGRTLISPRTDYKSAGKLEEEGRFVKRWVTPEKWDDSLEARLYAVRWADLNAKEEGRPEEATQFRSYQLAFDRFFDGRKRIKWTPRGELVVETKRGDIHDLSELSSGEKQVVLFMGELLHRWRPGSIILIDEPELHLHESYQTRLWLSLVDWQKERGGQVIVATQSGHLFRLAHSAMKVLLSRQSL